MARSSFAINEGRGEEDGRLRLRGSAESAEQSVCFALSASSPLFPMPVRRTKALACASYERIIAFAQRIG
jgi:hypothetical protein